MPDPSQSPTSRQTADADQLNLLSILHYVGAGLAVLGILFLFAHYMLFRAITTGQGPMAGQVPPMQPMPAIPIPIPGGPPGATRMLQPSDFLVFFQMFYTFTGLWFVATGVLNVISGISLRARKRRGFSIVVAAVNCLYVPLGTVLGVFTIVVLTRDTVRQLYRD